MMFFLLIVGYIVSIYIAYAVLMYANKKKKFWDKYDEMALGPMVATFWPLALAAYLLMLPFDLIHNAVNK